MSKQRPSHAHMRHVAGTAPTSATAQLEGALRIAADRAREAETAIRIARRSVGPAALELPALSAKYTAALGEVTAAARALMDHVGGDCPLCHSRGET